MTRFRDRGHAGEVLALSLREYARRTDVVVLGLARGGVVVAAAVAAALEVPLDVFMVRKLGAPGHEELAMGAIASGGVRVMNPDIVRSLRVSPDAIDAVARREQLELERRAALYRGDRPTLSLDGRTAIVVDDGLATGASMRAAVLAIKTLHPASVVVAVPTASRQARDDIAELVDDVVCVATPEPFWGVGAWYENFTQTSDDEVARLLRAAAEQRVHDG